MNPKKKIVLAYYVYRRLKKQERRKRRFWIHPILKKRGELGAFHTLVKNQLREDEAKFYNYFRMQKTTFDKLLQKLSQKLKHQDTNMRQSIPPAERLAVTLRYLATGATFTDLHYTYRIGVKTISCIVREVCQCIWSELCKEYMKMPSKEDWLQIANKFQESSDFPLCLGAVDGKHIRVIKPVDSGSMFLNYKHYFSIVLMAVVDSDYNFIFVDIGAYGKECDSSVFKETAFWKNLTNNTLNLPDEIRLPGTDYKLPFVFVADEAFALHYHLLRPFGGHQLDQLKRTFNYRLTRARRFVECGFGIFANKWRILHRPLNVSIDLAVDIVKACCILQNFVHKEEKFQFDNTSERESTFESESELTQLPMTNAVRGNLLANDVRNKFAQYFMSNEACVISFPKRENVRHHRQALMHCDTTLMKITPSPDAARRGAFTASTAALP
ncbi:unnamed protein product [Acanthoscelides obtectus]|uniref:DDE Tnp4 domain-containing protein n=1 Tax=Acanthoscelides obtectus TaxID=200917 RepID=A0A9P0Q9W7_ACAOB|nr:unnamed protein product [Acanthoscelides obtectus]CAH2012632.1 unnamed protein product [Acanthoscelides obtectus]CAK1624875.1 Protein ALP1-like [Acanthoscelides obtectus]CAK1685741.1 Protein ALP1-like [Acanthoscelides obtectus]